MVPFFLTELFFTRKRIRNRSGSPPPTPPCDAASASAMAAFDACACVAKLLVKAARGQRAESHHPKIRGNPLEIIMAIGIHGIFLIFTFLHDVNL